jgi:DNA polymerase III epsilon subunit-like protein
MKRYCVIDTETGGVGAEAAQRWSIIQLGACIYHDGVLPGVDQSFECVIKEESPAYHPEAMAINGFTRERIDAEGVSPSTAAMRFVLWLHRNFPVDQKVMLMGHNIGYDVSFLQRLFRLAGCLSCYDDIFHYRTIDTPSIKRFLENIGAAKEGELELEPVKPHDALSDAIATGRLYQKMEHRAKFPLLNCFVAPSMFDEPFRVPGGLRKRY